MKAIFTCHILYYVTENGRNIPFRLSTVARERLLFFLTKELVSGGNDRKARFKPYFRTFITKNFTI